MPAVLDPTPTAKLYSIHSAGEAFTLQIASPNEEVSNFSRSLERPPFSEDYFVIGDGKVDLREMRFDVLVQGTNLNQSIWLLSNLRGVAEAATYLEWDGWQREVFGLAGAWIQTPVVNGFRLSFAFAPKTKTWSQTFDLERLYPLFYPNSDVYPGADSVTQQRYL